MTEDTLHRSALTARALKVLCLSAVVAFVAACEPVGGFSNTSGFDAQSEQRDDYRGPRGGHR